MTYGRDIFHVNLLKEIIMHNIRTKSISLKASSIEKLLKKRIPKYRQRVYLIQNTETVDSRVRIALFQLPEAAKRE